jgi:hypothetical protein
MNELMWYILEYLQQYYIKNPNFFASYTDLFNYLYTGYQKKYRTQLSNDHVQEALVTLQQKRLIEFNAINSYKLTTDGKLALENRTKNYDELAHQAQIRSLQIAETINKIANESNEISRESRDIARRSSWIAVLSILVSIFAVIMAWIK